MGNRGVCRGCANRAPQQGANRDRPHSQRTARHGRVLALVESIRQRCANRIRSHKTALLDCQRKEIIGGARHWGYSVPVFQEAREVASLPDCENAVKELRPNVLEGILCAPKDAAASASLAS